MLAIKPHYVPSQQHAGTICNNTYLLPQQCYQRLSPPKREPGGSAQPPACSQGGMKQWLLDGYVTHRRQQLCAVALLAAGCIGGAATEGATLQLRRAREQVVPLSRVA